MNVIEMTHWFLFDIMVVQENYVCIPMGEAPEKYISGFITILMTK